MNAISNNYNSLSLSMISNDRRYITQYIFEIPSTKQVDRKQCFAIYSWCCQLFMRCFNREFQSIQIRRKAGSGIILTESCR